ncbi:hypothetical protein [Jeotgalibacillus sp. R-1-5s-1]|uniref:hypothetical protein n=1 Tax=Jeotgalibacillus sp. R-1-5s-1 TaxID=2555897 RepID=UPI00106A417B|nr:hypothetical protein [Jeotgalibacillus sp. R-1-5s-1]TFD97049.1 hypothetical protein E2491_10165 [Jeotgalibacillus sp. R-1-5s-1]
MDIAILIVLSIISISFYTFQRKTNEKNNQLYRELEEKLNSISNSTQQAFANSQGYLEEQADLASRERSVQKQQMSEMEKRFLLDHARGLRHLLEKIETSSNEIKDQFSQELNNHKIEFSQQLDEVKDIKNDLQTFVEKEMAVSDEKFFSLIKESTATLQRQGDQNYKSAISHAEEYTAKIFSSNEGLTKNYMDQLEKLQRDLTNEFLVLSEDVASRIKKHANHTNLSEVPFEQRQSGSAEEMWIAEIEKKENETHALKLLESALIQLPGSRPIFKMFYDRMLKKIREQKSAEQKLFLERLMKFTHDHLTWSHPQSWQDAFKDYKTLNGLRLQYAERSRTLFLKDFNEKFSELEFLLRSHENNDVLQLQMQQIDQNIQHSLLKHYPDEQKRYEDLASRLMEKLASVSDPKRITYNKWAIKKLSDIHSEFNALSESARSADHHVKTFSKSMAEIDTAILTTEAQIYYQSIYHEIFKVAAASFKPRMTEIVLEAKKESLGAV